jgi:hypothetical protein
MFFYFRFAVAPSIVGHCEQSEQWSNVVRPDDGVMDMIMDVLFFDYGATAK